MSGRPVGDGATRRAWPRPLALVAGRLERGADGLPVAGVFERRLALGILVVATTWFTLAAAWEFFGPLLAGHYASSASVGIIGENMWRWKIAGPVWEYTAARPEPAQYYCHHPWGIFWTTAGLLRIFGRHDFVCRLAPVLLSAATPPLLYAFGRALWRPLAGALAAAAFTVLPIALAFANFNALEVPVIAWSLLGLWGWVRHAQTSRARYLVASLVGFFMALHADWPAYVLVALVLGAGLFRGILSRRGSFGLVEPRAHARYWALLATMSVVSAALYLALFARSGKLEDFLGSAKVRSLGVEQSLGQVLEARRYWIELAFTPIAIALGKLAAVVCGLRVAARRSEHELVPLFVLAMALFQYLVFKQGADVHVYWPHYFALFFALGVGALADSALAFAATVPRFVAALRRRTAEGGVRDGRPALVAAAAVGLLVLGAILRDGVPALAYARATGGRFNEKGALIDSDGDKTAFLAWLSERIPATDSVALHEGMKPTWSQVWSLGGRVVTPTGAPMTRARAGHYLADTRFMWDSMQADLAARQAVVAVGPFWSVTVGQPAAPIEGYGFVEREPTVFEWYFVSGTEPVRTIVPSAWVTWELRTHFGQPADEPAGEPATLDELRIAHNLAVAKGEDPAPWLERLGEAFGEPSARFDDGTELVGVRFERGVRPLLRLLVRAPGPARGDVQLQVRSRVLSPPALSTTTADPTVREVGQPLGIAPLRWRKGFLYLDDVAIRKRPGREVFEAYFKPRSGKERAPRPVDGGAVVRVLELD